MEIIYIATLFFTFIAGESKNLRISSYSLIIHSLLIATAIFVLAYINYIPSLYLIAAIDILVRALLIPLLLIILLKNRLVREFKPSIIHPLSIALSIFVLSVGYNLINTFKFITLPNVLSCFSCGATLFIYGLFLLISKRDTVKMIISFFIIENGVHFLIISLLPHLPKIVELALTLNFVVAILFFIYVTMKLNEIVILEQIKKIKEGDDFYRLEE